MPITVPGWPVAFRGSLAVAADLTTPRRLRGSRFQRLFPDVYCPAHRPLPDTGPVIRYTHGVPIRPVPIRATSSAWTEV